MNNLSLNAILGKAEEGEGLTPEEVQRVFQESSPEHWEKIFRLARFLTRKNFQQVLYFFAPLYFSSFCINDCLYCGFRRSNRLLKRRSLTEEEFLKEASFLWNQGHRSLLLIAGEHPVYAGIEKIASHVQALKRENLPFSLMLEVGPLTTDEYKTLRELGIQQVLLFEETYDRESYARYHWGLKGDYDWRLKSMERARAAGIERVGLGILLGLHPYQEDLVELIRHSRYLKEKFGVFPATLSFPRLRSALGVSLLSPEMSEVSDEDFEKIIALARVALPSVGIVLTTREGPSLRRSLLQLGIGVTHMSAGSSTLPGGYVLEKAAPEGQFDLLDHRSLKEVSEEAKVLGYKPALSPE